MHIADITFFFSIPLLFVVVWFQYPPHVVVLTSETRGRSVQNTVPGPYPEKLVSHGPSFPLSLRLRFLAGEDLNHMRAAVLSLCVVDVGLGFDSVPNLTLPHLKGHVDALLDFLLGRFV